MQAFEIVQEILDAYQNFVATYEKHGFTKQEIDEMLEEAGL